MSLANPDFYEGREYGVFPCSPMDHDEPCVPDPLVSEESSIAANSTSSSGEEILLADDERRCTSPIVFRQTSSNASSRRSTPRSRTFSPRETAFSIEKYFWQYRMQCIDVTEDARTIAIASVKLHFLLHFAPEYFSTAADGLLFDDLLREYELFLSSKEPSHATSLRIGQLTERIKGLLAIDHFKCT